MKLTASRRATLNAIAAAPRARFTASLEEQWLLQKGFLRLRNDGYFDITPAGLAALKDAGHD